ncbi:ESPR-type extended signal peptide-containing protein [Stenotrophomonas maltophilia]|uniref:ESPR-type extended signal peptide-containing protein n=1 Tax=Stenotrophomonas maltophilia TaxID=40324 RepID=UPI000D7EADE8|nr:ESPR-type extended signal peptide-containing protein [Stenotrophomonas maltophilia]AWT16056.1 autotransporter [Stenotrophomonas maltophilia]MBA0363238.1 autotransporter [Stenotrophomonas maltophilia]HDS1129948.1 YadA-like family protein [Stenotrophomonas maltophilia]HDS1158465.1 YadA-like family protein [Stenotrophomonas maltophilia]HDS1166115.1 YadA-like family protein [Stenotrophomonas maltophilia]
MNHIYCRIWSTAKQCWVVASELAGVRSRNAGKTSSSAPLRILLLTSAMFSIATVYAAENQEVPYFPCEPDGQEWEPECAWFASGAPGVSSAAFSGRADLYYTGKGVAILGEGAKMLDQSAVAIGLAAEAPYSHSTAVGKDAKAFGDRSTALGSAAATHSQYSTAVGFFAETSGVDSVALGFHAKTEGSGHAVAVGTRAKAKGLGATSLGNSALAEKFNAIAIGSGARSSADNAIALGADSRATEVDSVSVGNSSTKLTRRIVNVTDARLTAASTDAVTGKQLYATNTKLAVIEKTADAAKSEAAAVRGIAQAASNRIDATTLALGRGATAENGSYGISTALGNNAKAYNGRSVALGDDARAGVDAEGNKVSGQNAGISIGAGTRSANGGVATGFRANASGNFSIAVGTDAKAEAEHSTAAGYLSKASASQTTALGRGSEATAQFASALGNLAKATTISAVALGDRAQAKHDNAVALGAGSVTASVDSVSVGSSSKKRKIQYIADGAVSAGSTDAVTGNQLHATHQAVSKAQTAADTAKSNADSALSKANALSGLLSQTSASGNVRVGESNSGTVLDVRNSASASRKITGVADATLSTTSTEAVSGKQLNATNSNVTAARSVADSAKTNADSALSKANTLSGLLSQASASGNVRVGESNSGTVLDVRNSTNASRKITGVADAALSSTSTDAVTGRQLNATNSNVSTALSDASAAKTSANTALTQVGTLNGLLSQASASSNVRIGEKNSGTVLDVRNSASVNRKLTGVADGVVSASSYEAVNGRQLNAINDKVATVEGVARSAGTEAAAAKTDAARALIEAAALGGLVAQVSESGNVRLGEKNSGTTLDVRNSINANRKISGVADGALDDASTEAVSGRQLYATNGRVSALEREYQFVSFGTDELSEGAETGSFGVAIGDSAKASPGGEGGTAVGAFANSLGRNSVAVGRGSVVTTSSENGFALGAAARVEDVGGVAIGASSKIAIGATNAVAIGAASEATEASTVSFGNSVGQRRLVNIARGTADHNATTVSQLKDSLATLGGAAGMDANGNIIAPTYTVQGETQNNVEDALMALDGAVITAGRRADKVEGQLNSIFQDSPSARADGMSQIALNGVNGMVLTNLADGRVAPGSRDAVTGNQLYAAEQKISQNRNDLDAMRKEREMGQQAMRELDASVIDYGGARLTGVAEAKLSADSSDVVRGSQLYETNSRILELEGDAQFMSIGSAPFSERAAAGVAGVAVGNSAKTGLEGGTAVGTFAEAMGRNSTAIGRAASVSVDSENGFAMGVGAQVGGGAGGANEGIAIGAGARVGSGAHGSLALGNSSLVDEEGVVSFGGVGMKRRLVNIANGTANHNAATVGQLRGALSALGGEVDANGNIVAPRFNVQGQAQSTLNGALEALDGAVVTNTSRVDKVETQLRSVFQDTPSVRADGVNQLTLAGANGMVISNVANGLIAAGSRDAVNGGQLHSMQQQLNGRMDGLEQRIDDAPVPRALATSSVPKPQAEETSVVPEGKDSQQVASVGEGDKPTPQPKANKDESPKPQVDTAELEKMLARANEYTDGAISNFERRLDKMDKRFNRMAAMSSAQTAMAMNTAGLATYNRLGAGVGYSEGESAMAVGYQRVLNEKGSATFSLNGAFTNSGERSMGVGVGIGW